MPCKVSAVDIWTFALDEKRPFILSGDEAQRAARFHFERDREHWSGARTALRLVLARYLRQAPLGIEFVVGEHGKPALAASPLQFNLSHAHGWAMIAVSQTTPVGVDLEAIRDRVDMAKLLTRIDEKDLPTDRTALFQRWTEREARTKAAGSPLMQQPDANIRAVPLTAPSGFVASVALVGAVPQPTYCGSL